MKRNKLVLVIKILAIIIICLIGFVGIYLPWKKSYEMNNVIKDYTLSKDLVGYREITLEAHEDEEENSKEDLTEENFKKSKSIIEKRLNALGVQDYNLSLDKSTGTIYIQIPEDDMTDKVVSNITQTGSVEIKDSEDEDNVLISSDKLKKASYFYNTASSGKTTVYLELQFNKEGKEILKNISENEYKTLPEKDESEETDSEETESEESDEEKSEESEEEEQKKVTLYMSGSSTTTTSFDEVIEDGKIHLSMSSATTDTDTINDALKSASIITVISNNGILPLNYEVGENKYVEADISSDSLRPVMIAFGVIVAILLVFMIIKYKGRGILEAICFIGFVAIYLIALRIFNVTIALTGILGGMAIIILNYLVSMNLIKVDNRDNKKYYKNYLDIIMKLIPILALSIIFVFMPITLLSSLGMVMFWGIVLILLYNVAITKHIVD